MSGVAAYRLLVRRLVVARELRRPLLVPAVVALLFTAFYLMLCGFALSGQQQAQRDLGAADHLLGVPVPPGAAIASRSGIAGVERALTAGGIGDASVRLSSYDVHPDGLPQALTTGSNTAYQYYEMSASARDFPGVYRLDSGRWPTRPGEVAISPGLRDRLGPVASFTALSGLVRFRIVGIVANRFATDSLVTFAAPGSWSALPGSAVARRFVGATANVEVRWRTGSAGIVAEALHQAAPNRPPADLLLTGLIDSRSYRGRGQLSLVDAASFVFTVPLVLLVLAGVAIAGRMIRGWIARVLGTAVGVGLTRGRLLAVLIAMATGATVLATAAGVLAGLVVGSALRAVMAAAFLTRPLGPVRPLGPMLALIGGVALLVMPLVLARLAVSGRPSRLQRLGAVVPWGLIRRVVAVVLLVRTVLGAGRGLNTLDAVAPVVVSLVAAALLVVPDLLRALVRVLPVARPRGLLSRRLLEADRTRFAVMALLIAACVAVPTATSTFVATDTRTQAAMNVSLVPAGQLWVDNEMPATSPARTLLARALPSARPVSFGWPQAFTEGDPSAVGAVNTGVETIDSASELRRIVGRSVTAAAMEALDRGEVLLWTGRSVNRHVQTQSGTSPPTSLPIRYRFVTGVPAEYQGAMAGVMLTSTARALRLPITPATLVYPDVSDRQIRDVLHLFEKTGYDTHPLQYRVVPPPTKPTRDWYTAMIGLLLIAALVLGSLMRAHGEHLRGYGARFLSLGLGPRWVIGVALVEFGVVLLAGGVLAAAAGFGAVALVATSGTSHLVLDVPYGFVALNISSVLVLSVLALLFSLRTVTARERAG